MTALRGFIVIALVIIAYAALRPGGICLGPCKTNEVKRKYRPETLEFKVSGDYDANGKTLAAIHTFKLAPFETMKGTGFGYNLPANNDHGQDGK